VTAFSAVGDKLGFPLPDGMRLKQLLLTGVIAGLGLTVALFVSGQAFVDSGLQGAAKMGALFSGGVAFLAVVLGKLLNVRDESRQTIGGWIGWWAVLQGRMGRIAWLQVRSVARGAEQHPEHTGAGATVQAEVSLARPLDAVEEEQEYATEL